jgi:hypothetical protein
MPTGKIPDLQAMAKADPGFTDRPEPHQFHIVGNLAKWKKRTTPIGNGHCPVLTQVASGAPKVKFWKKGPIVKGNVVGMRVRRHIPHADGAMRRPLDAPRGEEAVGASVDQQRRQQPRMVLRTPARDRMDRKSAKRNGDPPPPPRHAPRHRPEASPWHLAAAGRPDRG